MWVACEQRRSGHDLPRLAVAALNDLAVEPGLLDLGARRVAPIASIVVISEVPMLSTGVMQDRMATPSTCTVQAPHSAMPQPNFVPVMPSTSRNTHRRGVSPSTSTVRSTPLTFIVVAIATSGLFARIGHANAATKTVAARRLRSSRRLGRRPFGAPAASGRYISSLVCCVNSTTRRSLRSPTSRHRRRSAPGPGRLVARAGGHAVCRTRAGLPSGSPALQHHTPPSPNSRNATVTRSGVVCMIRAYVIAQTPGQTALHLDRIVVRNVELGDT